MPGESTDFTPSSILFRPRHSLQNRCPSCRLWWRRRVPPPGPIGLFRRPFIAIADLHRRTEYRGLAFEKKVPMAVPGGDAASRAAAADDGEDRIGQGFAIGIGVAGGARMPLDGTGLKLGEEAAPKEIF